MMIPPPVPPWSPLMFSFIDMTTYITLSFSCNNSDGVESCKNEAGASLINLFYSLITIIIWYNTLPIMREDIFMVHDGEVMG